MKVCEYSRFRLFLDLGPMSFTYENQNLLFSKNTLGHFNPILYVSFTVQEMKIYLHDAGHKTKLATMRLAHIW